MRIFNTISLHIQVTYQNNRLLTATNTSGQIKYQSFTRDHGQSHKTTDTCRAYMVIIAAGNSHTNDGSGSWQRIVMKTCSN